MRWRNKFGAIVGLLVLLGVPGLSCFVPQQLTAAESQCCRNMGDKCGSAEMPSSHSCCKSPRVQSAQPYIGSSAKPLQTAPIAGETTALPFSYACLVVGAGALLTLELFESPPLSPPETN